MCSSWIRTGGSPQGSGRHWSGNYIMRVILGGQTFSYGLQQCQGMLGVVVLQQMQTTALKQSQLKKLVT